MDADEPLELRLRALADVFGGFDGGLAFARASVAGLDAAAARAGERSEAFSSWPRGWFNRLLLDVGDALRLAALAVAVQDVLNGDDFDDPSASIADLLERRAREATGESAELYAAGARARDLNLELNRRLAEIGAKSTRQRPPRASSRRGRRPVQEP